MVSFEFHHFYYVYQLSFHCKKKFLFISLPISGWTHDFLFHSLGYNVVFFIFILILKLSQVWSEGAPLSWLWCPFDMFPLFTEHLIIFWHKKMLQSHLVLPLPQPQIQLFLQGVLVSFSGGWCLDTKISVLGVFIVIGCRCCQLSVGRAREYMHVYIHMYTNLSI